MLSYACKLWSAELSLTSCLAALRRGDYPFKVIFLMVLAIFFS